MLIQNITSKLAECQKLVNFPLNRESIDRFHRIGPSYVDENTGKTCKSLIVKCNSWMSRKEFYNARPRNHENGKNKSSNRTL